MKVTITSIVLSRGFLATLFILLIFGFGWFVPNRSSNVHRFVQLNELLPPSTSVFYYLPNTLIAKKLKQNIQQRAIEIFDTTAFRLVDVVFDEARTTNAAKPFELKLVQTNSPNAAAVIKKGSISGSSNDLKITIKNRLNQDLTLFEGNIEKLTSIVKGSISYRYDGKTIVDFKGKSIVLSYSQLDNTTNEIIKYMESKSSYQMLGLAVVFPSQFIESYTATRSVELTTNGSETISKIEMSKIKTRSTPDGKLAVDFLIDNGTLPTQLKGKAIVDKKISILERMYGYTYSKDNLSQVEVQLMDYFAKQVEDYANQRVVNMRLVPRVDGDSILFTSQAGVSTGVKTSGGRINYFKENIICSLDLEL